MALSLLLAAGLFPLVAAGIGSLPGRRHLSWVVTLVADSGVILIGALVIWLHPVSERLAGTFLLSPLAGILLVVVGSVALLAASSSNSYLDHQLLVDPLASRKLRLYWSLFNLFTFTMILAVVSNNLGIIWIAVEATTVSTAFLVGFKRTPLSLEAAWKYAVICSFGLSVALLGVIVIYFGAITAGIPNSQALTLTVLLSHARELNPAVLRLGIALCIVGFGTKAGLVPFHTWLPDAHSQAPAPISAMMSGVLLSVAASVVLRVVQLSAAGLGPSYARFFLLTIGILTMAVGAFLIVGQRELKRMLAQSSMEQMGIVAVAIAINTELAIAALLLHIFVHGLAKGSAFITAGQMEDATGKHRISEMRGLVRTHPLVARGFLLALIALVALPPFGLFWTEAAIVTAVVRAGDLGAAIAVVALLLVAAVGLVRTGLAITLSDPPVGVGVVRSVRASIPVAAATVVAVVIGILGAPTTQVIGHAASSILRKV